MNTELLSFTTKDKLELPGLLYTPERKTEKVLIDLHGNGTSSQFYNTVQNKELSTALTKSNIAYFPFNNRGAQLINSFSFYTQKKKKRMLYGCAYERIKECIIDIDAAVSFLRKKGLREFYLIGHSTGANKICIYNYYKKRSIFKKYILSAGGDDTGIYYTMLGKRKFFHLLQQAKKYSSTKKGRELVTDVLYPAISWGSLYDTINPDGDYNIFPYNEYFNNLKLSRKKLFREFSTIRKPTLVVYGELDEYLPRTVDDVIEVLKKHTNNREMDFSIIQSADHSFKGEEKQFAHVVAKWVST